MSEKEALQTLMGQYLFSTGLADNITGMQLKKLLEPLIDIILTKDWQSKLIYLGFQMLEKGN